MRKEKNHNSDRKFNGGTITFVSENEADTKVFKIF